MKNICASCRSVDVKNIIKVDNKKKPKWLEKTDYVQEFVNNVPLKIYKKNKANMKLKINVGKSNKDKYILYWGAKSSSSILIKDAKKAYGNFTNYGVTKVGKNGDVTLFFDCPQPYSTTEKGKNKRETFYRHLHFCLSNISKTNWSSSIYTKIIICDMSLRETMILHNKGVVVLINALPHSYYAKSHIPNSFNLYNKTIKKMSQNELFDWFSEVIETNYPKINKLIKKKKLSIYEIPIIVYCAHNKCDAGYLSAIELLKKGFVNLMDFKGGMKDYLN
tara:strand:- start:2332 stop:3162 length:831 start_codon:yes stop_codon:yes gene_type:complete